MYLFFSYLSPFLLSFLFRFLQCDFGSSCLEEYKEVWKTLHSGERARRKVRGAVPHDLGNPGVLVNIRVCM